MNMMVLIDAPEAPWRLEEFRRPARAANQPLRRNNDGRVGKFEDMDPSEAADLLKAMDGMFAKV